MNSKLKGGRGEREFAALCRDEGYENTKRGQHGQYIKGKNKLIIYDGILECYHADGTLLFFTNDSFTADIMLYSWAKLADGYSAALIDGQAIMIHRYLLKPNDGQIVDHINRNKKDNRLCNLRICDKSLNAFNSKIRANNRSGRTGVRRRKDTGKWCAEIKVNCQKINLGCYANMDAAVSAREQAELSYYGEVLNNAY